VNNGSSDACGIKSLALSKTSFDCSNVGENEVTLTVTDNNGNVSTTTATVTVEDHIAPVATAQNVTVQLNANGSGSTTASAVNNGSSDACGIKSMTLSKTSFNCSNIGDNEVTLTVTDNNDNVSTTTATVTVEDNVAPVAKAQNVTVQLNANGNGSTTATAVDNGSTDACGIKTLALSQTSFDCSNIGDNEVTLTVTDNNGNVSTTTATVTVEDHVAPIAIAQNVTIVLVNGSASTTATAVNNGSTDACGIKSLTLSKTSFNCSNIGSNTVTLTVTDNNNNVSTATATVTVTGVVPSCSIASAANNSGTVIGSTTTGAGVNQMFLGYGAQSMKLTCTATGGGPFTYSWTGSNLSSTTSATPIFTPTTGGTYTFTCVATNSYGCQTSCTISICVLDIRAGGSGNGSKVYLCHVPPGNPNNPQTLNISINAVPSHLGNHGGDRLGSCSQVCGSAKTETPAGELFSEETTLGEVDLIVYPNPSNSVFNFRLESQSDELVSFRLYDMSGRLITSMDNLSPKEVITTQNNLDVGMFMAEITQGEFRKVVKITKVN
jgi:PKD repeat protein